MTTIVVTQLNLSGELEDLVIQLVPREQASVQLSSLTLQPTIVEEIQVTQESDPKLQEIR